MNKYIKRLKCNHQNKKCLTNVCGDYILVVSSWSKIYRSIWECQDCGKIIRSEYLDSDCNYINWRKT